MLHNEIDTHKGIANQEGNHENQAHPLLDAFMDKVTQAVGSVDLRRDVEEPLLASAVGPFQIVFNDLSHLTGHKLGKLEIVDEAAENRLRSSDDWFAQRLSVDAICSSVPSLRTLNELVSTCSDQRRRRP